MNWNNINVGKYKEIIELEKSDLNNIEKGLKLYEILTGENPDNLTLSEFNKRQADLDINFLQEPIPEVKLKKKYNLGGRIYNVVIDSDSVSTAQYFNFTTLMQSPDRDLTELAACFLIPEGYKYGEFDNEVIKEDIDKYLSVVDINSMIFFSKLKLKKLSKRFRDSLIFLIMTTKGMTLKQKGTLINSLRTFFKSTESLIMSSPQ